MITAHQHIQRGTAAYYRVNLALFFAGFVTFSTLYDFQPLLPILAGEFSVSPATASLALSVATFALAVTLPVAGSLSEAFGRRRLMGVAVVASALLALATAVSTTVPSLVALRLLQGIVLAGVPGVAMAYLSEEVEPKAMSSAMGLYIAGNAFGGMTGRIFTAWLADFMPWRGAIGVIGALALLMALAFITLAPPSRHFQRQPLHIGALTASLLRHLREPGLFCLFTIAFACMGSFVTLYNYVTFLLLGAPYHLSQSQVALIFLSYALGAVGSSTLGGFIDRVGRLRLLFISLAVMTGGALLTLFTSVPVVIAGIAIFTVGFFASHTIASAWVGTRARGARAQAASLYLFSYYLGSSISGTGGGFVWSAWGWSGVVTLVITLIFVAALAAQRLGRLEGATRQVPVLDEEPIPAA